MATLVLVFAAYQLWGSHLSERRSQRELTTELTATVELASAFVQAGRAPNPEPPRLGAAVALLEVPAIELKRVVTEGSGNEQLARGPGHVQGTPFPGQEGNSVMFGHRTLYGAAFRDLDTLKPGEELVATTGQGRFSYKVSKVGTVSPGEPDVFGQGDSDSLTLVTSHPKYLSSERLVVVADLQGEPVEATTAVADGPQVLGPEELGVAGDPGGWPRTMLWGALLLAGVTLTRRLYRTWERWPTYLITSPILFALAILWLESISRLLPSTL